LFLKLGISVEISALDESGTGAQCRGLWTDLDSSRTQPRKDSVIGIILVLIRLCVRMIRGSTIGELIDVDK